MPAKPTYLVRHQRDEGPIYVEYSELAGAEEAAQFLIQTQAGAATVFAVRELMTFWRGSDLRLPPVVNPTGGVE